MRGYTIAVSILANNNPIGIILSSFVFGVLSTGATAMQRVADVSSVIVYVFQGVVVLLLAFSTTLSVKKFNNYLNRTKSTLMKPKSKGDEFSG